MNKKSFFKISFTFIIFFINNMLFATKIEKEIFFSSYLKGINLAKAEGKILIKPNKLRLYFTAQTVGIFSLISEWKQTLSIDAKVINNKFCRILSWYDNEWGFSNRLVDVMLELSNENL